MSACKQDPEDKRNHIFVWGMWLIFIRFQTFSFFKTIRKCCILLVLIKNHLNHFRFTVIQTYLIFLQVEEEGSNETCQKRASWFFHGSWINLFFLLNKLGSTIRYCPVINSYFLCLTEKHLSTTIPEKYNTCILLWADYWTSQMVKDESLSLSV